MEQQHWARVLDGIVAEPPIAFDPAGFYAPEILETFFPCPADTRQGARHDAKAGTFTNPPAPPEPEPAEPAPPAEPAYRTAVTKTEYYGLFEPLEEAMIRLTASKTVTAEMVEGATPADREKLLAVAVLKVMLSRVDNLSVTQTIQLDDQQVRKGLALCVQMTLLTEPRAAEIARGVAVPAGASA